MSSIQNLSQNNAKIASNLTKLSSGKAINKAADNPAGLAISEKMKANITSLNQEFNNNYDSINYSNISEDKLGGVHSILNRMSELASESSNGTYANSERSALQAEFSQLSEQIAASGMNVGVFDISTQDGAIQAVNGLKDMINTVSLDRGQLGSQINRQEHATFVDEITSENLQASNAKIADADMAKQMMDLTKNKILSQASISMMIHEKQNAAQVLSLLK